MKKPKNIVLISLNECFCKSVASELAGFLDMYVADCHDLLVYDLINPQDVLEKCGVDYLQNRERSVLESCSEYENTVLSINYDLFYQHNCLFANSLVVYLCLPQGQEDKVANKINYANRHDLLLEKADIVIELQNKSIKKTLEKIVKKLGELYENCCF